jgi:hypothetical protein
MGVSAAVVGTVMMLARFIDAVTCADIISEKLNIPLDDLVDVFAEVPTADVVERSSFEQVSEKYLSYQQKHLAGEYIKAKHGEWRIHSDGYFPYCSHCCEEPQSGLLTKYCSNCGAEMKGAML